MAVRLYKTHKKTLGCISSEQPDTKMTRPELNIKQLAWILLLKMNVVKMRDESGCLKSQLLLSGAFSPGGAIFLRIKADASTDPRVLWFEFPSLSLVPHEARPKESLKAISTGTSATESWKHT